MYKRQGIGGAILLGDHWRVLDPVAAVIVSFCIMKVAVQLLIPCVDERLEKSLPVEVEDEILKTILSFPGISSPHHPVSYTHLDVYKRQPFNYLNC